MHFSIIQANQKGSATQEILMINSVKFLENLSILRERISDACSAAGRNPNEVNLLPVTKNWPVDAVRHCLEAGINRVGENRVQETVLKQEEIQGVKWELIGHLQSNKVKQSIGRFSRIQTLDSLKLIRKVSSAAEELNQTIPVLIQVNSGNDPAKYGFKIEEVSSALDLALQSNYLAVEGLMTIAPYAPGDLSIARKCFDRLADLQASLKNSHGLDLKELSMGMSGDLTQAIAAGSTMIRVGSALFGDRSAI